jgi:hypothetical protein
MKQHPDPDKVLSSLDSIQKAEAPPFFYGMLRARMEKGIPETTVRRPMALRPVLATAVLSIALFVNIVLLTQKKTTVQNTPDQPATIESFASAYGLGTSSVY